MEQKSDARFAEVRSDALGAAERRGFYTVSLRWIMWVSIILGAVVIVVWFMTRRAHQLPPVGPAVPPSASSNKVTQSNPPTAAVSHPDGQSPVVSKPANVPEQVWQLTLEMHKRGLTMNGPVVFYGKVIDQDEAAVPQTSVQLAISGYDENHLARWAVAVARTNNAAVPTNVEPMRKETIELLTDEDGKFSVTDKTGSAIAIDSVQKEGYITVPWYFGSFSYGPRGNPPIEYGQTYTDSNTPVVFHLWKKGQTEPLITHSLTAEVVFADKSPDTFLNLITGEAAAQIASGRADLVVRSLAPSAEQRTRKIT